MWWAKSYCITGAWKFEVTGSQSEATHFLDYGLRALHPDVLTVLALLLGSVCSSTSWETWGGDRLMGGGHPFQQLNFENDVKCSPSSSPLLSPSLWTPDWFRERLVLYYPPSDYPEHTLCLPFMPCVFGHPFHFRIASACLVGIYLIKHPSRRGRKRELFLAFPPTPLPPKKRSLKTLTYPMLYLSDGFCVCGLWLFIVCQVCISCNRWKKILSHLGF